MLGHSNREQGAASRHVHRHVNSLPPDMPPATSQLLIETQRISTPSLSTGGLGSERIFSDRDRPNPCRCASGEHPRPTNGDYARNSRSELPLVRNASGRLRDCGVHIFLWLHEDGGLP